MITLIIGCMFSGKTSELLRLIKKYKISDKKSVLIKYNNDNRYSTTEIMDHSKQLSLKAEFSTNKLSDIENQILDEFEVIGIDEGQFFEDIHIVNNWANMGKIIIISALDSDYKSNPFKNITDLIAKAEKIEKLTAICFCCKNDNATFTIKLNDNENLIEIGGFELYKPVCRNCRIKLIKK